MAFGKKKDKHKRISTSVAAARTSDAALNAIRQDQAEEDQQDAIVRSNVYKMIDQGTCTIVDLWARFRCDDLAVRTAPVCDETAAAQ